MNTWSLPTRSVHVWRFKRSDHVPHGPNSQKRAIAESLEAVEEDWVVTPSLPIMDLPSRTSTEDHCEPSQDEDDQGEDLEYRCKIFEITPPLV